MRYQIVYTSMIIEADSPEEALEEHQCNDSGGGHWEAVPVADELPVTCRHCLYLALDTFDLQEHVHLNHPLTIPTGELND